MEVPLGGSVNPLQIYGELVISVINPSHRIARPDLAGQVAAAVTQDDTVTEARSPREAPALQGRNAMGRLRGMVLSSWVFQLWGFTV